MRSSELTSSASRSDLGKPLVAQARGVGFGQRPFYLLRAFPYGLGKMLLFSPISFTTRLAVGEPHHAGRLARPAR